MADLSCLELAEAGELDGMQRGWDLTFDDLSWVFPR